MYRFFIENKYRYIKLTAVVIFTAIFNAFCASFGFVLRAENNDCLAALLAFVFAFITNKICVFESKEWKSQTAIKETLEFLFARLTTLLVDSVLMWLFIDIITMNELISKIFVNIIVIVINYFASKFWIFRKNQNK